MRVNERNTQTGYTGQEEDPYDLYSAVDTNYEEAQKGAPQASRPVVDGDGDGGAGALNASLSYDHGVAASDAVAAEGGEGDGTGWHYEEGEEQYDMAYDVDNGSLSPSPPPLTAAAAAATEETPQPIPHHDDQSGTIPEPSWQPSPENAGHTVNPHVSYEEGEPEAAHDAAAQDNTIIAHNTPVHDDDYYDIDGATVAAAAVNENSSRRVYDGEASDPNGSTMQGLLGSVLYSATTEVDVSLDATAGSTFRGLMGSALVATAVEGEKKRAVSIRHQQQQQQGVEEAGEDSEDLYDIDDKDLSSDDD